VHVVGEGSRREAGDGVPAHQLAWDFDLVIATFQQLSSQWSRHREGKADGAPLLQARPYFRRSDILEPAQKDLVMVRLTIALRCQHRRLTRRQQKAFYTPYAIPTNDSHHRVADKQDAESCCEGVPMSRLCMSCRCTGCAWCWTRATRWARWPPPTR